MLASFSFEAIGLQTNREIREFSKWENANGTKGRKWPIGHWVAVITGTCQRFGFSRKFLTAHYDHSNSDSRGDRGVIANYFLDEGLVYEADYLVSRRSRVRKILAAQNGTIREITKQEAISIISSPGYAVLVGSMNKEPEAVKPQLPKGESPSKQSLQRMLGVDVLQAAKQRISWAFSTFPAIYLSFSAGKDSTVMLHLAAEEARRIGRRFGLLLIDLEAQYSATIKHAEGMFDEYADVIDPYWIALPLSLRNAVSNHQPQWRCWDTNLKNMWVRSPPHYAITDGWQFDFFTSGMEFEDFVAKFGTWYGRGKPTACLVGIRTDESLNRWRAIVREHAHVAGRKWTIRKPGDVVNVYPIYDWKTDDIWTYHAKTGKPYNSIYDLMHKAGLTPHQMRICQPYGDDQRKGLWLYHVLEPETWPKIVARVEGANSGALHARDTGNMMGIGAITLPPGHTWQSFAKHLLMMMPPHAREHYENKIAVFLKWYSDRGYYDGIPDEYDREEEAAKRVPSWRRICKVILRNDWWCKGLSFSQHKSDGYERYLKVMKNRRREWGI